MQARRKTQPVPLRPRLRIGFILARRFTLCAFANFVDVLRLAADEGDRSRQILCEWTILSDNMAPVVSSCGARIQPNGRVADPTAFDYVVVVGGLIDEIPNVEPNLRRFLHRAAQAGVPLVGICTGAFIIHREGLMEGYQCCVSWFHHADFLEQFDGLRPVSDQIFVVDRDRLTCSGGVNSAHLAALLVQRHVGADAANKSLRIMMIDRIHKAEQPQPAMHLDEALTDDIVRRATLQMHLTLEEPLDVDELARRLDVTRRSLERRFRKVLGTSPARHYTNIRLDHAGLLLRTTEMTVSSIAMATGFSDGSHLIRCLKARDGLTSSGVRATKIAQEPD